MIELFIPGNVPSLKNSKIKTSRGVFPSKTVTKYLRSLGIQSYSSRKKEVKEYKDINRPNIFKEVFSGISITNYPCIFHFHFIRKSRHKFDFINACQIVADLMVAHDIIEDDNMDYFIPFPLLINDSWYSYNKEKPGVIIRIET